MFDCNQKMSSDVARGKPEIATSTTGYGREVLLRSQERAWSAGELVGSRQGSLGGIGRMVAQVGSVISAFFRGHLRSTDP